MMQVDSYMSSMFEKITTRKMPEMEEFTRKAKAKAASLAAAGSSAAAPTDHSSR